MNNRLLRFSGSIMLVFAAMIWGSAFVAQSIAAENVEPFMFTGLRSLVGSLAIAPVFLTFDRVKPDPNRKNTRLLLIGGILCGIFLFMACNLQQFAISYTDTTGMTQDEIEAMDSANVGKVGFLTTLYIVIVPLFGIFMKKRLGLKVWLGILVAAAGMYMLCIKPGFTVSGGDVFAILCAFGFAAQITVVDLVVKKVDPVRLSCVQFLVCGVLSVACALVFENNSLTDILRVAGPVLYTGVMSSGIAYTLQILGQARCRPVVASLIMSLESVFSAVFGFLILGQGMTVRELFGCVLMLGAVVLAQLPDKENQNA